MKHTMKLPEISAESEPSENLFFKLGAERIQNISKAIVEASPENLRAETAALRMICEKMNAQKICDRCRELEKIDKVEELMVAEIVFESIASEFAKFQKNANSGLIIK